jgi:hypothetical protein
MRQMPKHVKTSTTADRAIMAMILELIFAWLLLFTFAPNGYSLLPIGAKDPGAVGNEEGSPAMFI